MTRITVVLILAVFLTAGKAYATDYTQDTNALVAYPLKTDIAPSTTVSDETGNSRDGTLKANGEPDFDTGDAPSGYLDGSYLWDSSDDVIEDADAEDYINGLDDISICMWVKAAAINSDRGFLICTAPSGSDETVTIRYDSAGGSGGGDDVIKVGITRSGVDTQYESAEDAQTASWQHITVLAERNEQVKLYINATLDTPTHNDAARDAAINNVTTLILGKGGKDGSAAWGGNIRDFIMFDRILETSEITDIYNNGITGSRRIIMIQ